MRAAWKLGGWLVVAVTACSSTPSSGAGGTGGSGGVVEAGSGGTAGAGGASGDAEPPGPRVLTLLHGVVDAPRLRFCLGPAGGPVSGNPMPAGGLSFGGALVVRSVAGLDLGSDALQIYAVTGDDAVIAGRSCQSLLAQANAQPDAGADASSDAAADGAGPDASSDAASDASSDASPVLDAGSDGEASAPLPPPPPLRVATLPVLPPGTLALKSSYLLAVMGCIGQSEAFTDSLSDSVCGTGYRPDRPTLFPALVRMSRATRAGALGLQVVDASRATASLTLGSAPPKGSAQSSITIAANVKLGAIEPASADLSHAISDFGSPLASATLQVTLSTGGSPDFTEPWSAAMSAAGLSSLQAGSDYAVVVIGPNATVGGDKWWHAPLVTLVPTAP